MSFWFGLPQPPPPPPTLETLFLELLTGMGGGQKMTPPFCWVENQESFGFFFDFEPKKGFRVPTPWGLYGAESDER